MQSRDDGERDDENRSSGRTRSALFIALLLFFFITTTPFADLNGAAATDPQAGNSNVVNQVAIVFITGGLWFAAARHRLASTIILQPRSILVPLFLWFALVSAVSPTPEIALRKVVLAVMIAADASILLLMPRSERQFAKLLLIATAVMLGVAYFGVALIPGRAIHQASDLIEPEHAGLWHGQFPHKNVAAAVMVLASFIGLFVRSSGYRLWGIGIVAAASVFLVHTGGKSALGYLPATIVVAWVFERWRWTRLPIVIGGPILFNAVAIGCALSDGVRQTVQSVGLDPTFTARTDIWRLALGAIAQRPITGYGFQGFWQTDALFYGGGTLETWAVQAFNGHNSWIDLVLTTGLPAMVLVFIWLVALPLRDVRRAEASANDPALTRLFIRIWLYGLFSAGLETVFFENGEPLWLFLLMAVFGLRLQGAARLCRDDRWTGPAFSPSLDSMEAAR